MTAPPSVAVRGGATDEELAAALAALAALTAASTASRADGGSSAGEGDQLDTWRRSRRAAVRRTAGDGRESRPW
jgi:hypothetical protein